MPVTSALLLYIPFTVGQSHVLVLLDSGFEYGAPLRTSALAKRYPNPVNHTLDSKRVVLMCYVIQVINGREHVMRERIERVVPVGAMQELFYPQYQTEIKVHGEWISTTKPLFSRLSYLRYSRSPYRATVPAAHGRLCSGAFPGRSVCAAGKRRDPTLKQLYA